MKLFLRTISCLALGILLAVGAFSVLGWHSAIVEAREECTMREVLLDEGYGVSRVELREICQR